MRKITVLGGLMTLAVAVSAMSAPRAFAVCGGNVSAGGDGDVAVVAEPKRYVGGGSEIIGRFDRRFAALDSLIFGGAARERLSTRGAADALDVDSTPAVSAQLDAALRANTLDKIREGNGKTGLEITGQTYYRLKGNGGYEDETGEGHYRAKFQAELRWYIFQSSLLGQGGRRRVAA